jgi:uncharacterized membrane protein YedE/YeeE
MKGMTLAYLALGTAFGLVLSRSGAADYGYIQKMFLFQDFQLYGIIGVAVAVTAPGLWLLQRWGRTATGEPLRLGTKPLHRGSLIGGALFGVGWAMTGMCPGPIFVNLGEGKLYAVAALAGALSGTWLYGRLRPRLAKPLRLPNMQAG